MKKTFALVGNPNSGKTALFNLLTASGEPSGNRAGVTFCAKKEPLRRFGKKGEAYIMDLPGIYSLNGGNGEERAALLALKKERPDVILNIVDATDLERGLRLTLSLFSLGIPMVIALTMTDELPRLGLVIDNEKLEARLGIPVFPISSVRKTGMEALIRGALSAKAPPPALHFANIQETVRHIQALLAGVQKSTPAKPSIDDRIDALICRPYIGIPLFFVVMSLVFSLTFSSLGAYLSSLLEKLFSIFSSYLHIFLFSIDAHPLICTLLTDGIWRGVSAVLTFMPQTAILFFLLAALEDLGYLTRAAFVMDALMRRLGISGKAIVPIVIGFGCTVPAVMSTVTLAEEEKESVIYALPFLPCSARLPLILMISSVFFPKHRTLAALFLYAISIFACVLSLLLSRKKEQTAPLIMELPRYRLPHPLSLFREAKNKLRDFLVRAGTVVFLSETALSLFSMLGTDLRPVSDPSESLLIHIGNALAPLFAPLGFDEGRLVLALVAGFFAKESIVGTIELLIPEGAEALLTPAAALSFAVFALLYLPCAATLGAMKSELGKRKTALAVLRFLLFAAVFSYLFYTLARILSK